MNEDDKDASRIVFTAVALHALLSRDIEVPQGIAHMAVNIADQIIEKMEQVPSA